MHSTVLSSIICCDTSCWAVSGYRASASLAQPCFYWCPCFWCPLVWHNCLPMVQLCYFWCPFVWLVSLLLMCPCLPTIFCVTCIFWTLNSKKLWLVLFSILLQLFRQIYVSYVSREREEDKTWDFLKNDGRYGSVYWLHIQTVFGEQI